MNAPQWITADRLTATFTAIMAITGLLALGLAYRQLRQDNEEAQVQHLLDFDHQFVSEPMIGYRKAYAEKRLKGVVDPDEEYRLLDFFEGIGLLVNRGYLNDKDVWEDYSYWIFPLYVDTRDMLDQDQKDDPSSYTNFVALEKRLESIETSQHGTFARPSKDDLHDVWEYESSVVPDSPIGHSKRPPVKSPAK